MRIEYDKNGEPKVIRSEFIEEADTTKKNPSKFYNIPYLSVKELDTFCKDEEVWIEEKLDGTNVNCFINENNEFKCYGRRYELGTWYTNHGAYEELLKLEDKVKQHCNNLVLYFEWLTLHHVRYDINKENKLYLIGVKNQNTGMYLTPDEVYDIANLIEVETPQCFYHGKFMDWSVAKSLVGTSAFGAKQGEGVIVKAFDYKKGIKMVKLVASDFREIMKYDPSRVEAKLNAEVMKREKVKTIVTDARIRKMMLHMIDEGLIPSLNGLNKEQKSLAIKTIGKMIYHDCIKEEPEFVIEFGKDFGRYSFMLSREFIQNLE